MSLRHEGQSLELLSSRTLRQTVLVRGQSVFCLEKKTGRLRSENGKGPRRT